MSSTNVAIETPVMTKEMFAKKVGLSEQTIKGMVYANSLPTVKCGKHRLINIAALTTACLERITTQVGK